MAVMKTCCGCLTTKSGTVTILLLYTLAYIGAIVAIAAHLGPDGLEKWYADQLTGESDCKTGSNKDAWWCDAIDQSKKDVKAVGIAFIVLFVFLIITSVIGVFGATKDSPWFLMPWIVFKFIILALLTTFVVLVIVLAAVYLPEGGDSSYVIASGVIAAAAVAFLFYIWLCVVSHFQLLREVAKLSEKEGQDNSMVQPFGVMHDDVRSINSVEDVTQKSNMSEDEDDYHPENNAGSVAGSRAGSAAASRAGSAASRVGSRAGSAAGNVKSRAASAKSNLAEVVEDFEATPAT